MKTKSSHSTQRRKKNAKQKLAPVKSERAIRKEAQSAYLDLAIAEKSLVMLIGMEGLQGDDPQVFDVLNKLEDREAANAILDYINAYQPEFDHKPMKLDTDAEMSRWMGCTKERVGQIAQTGLKTCRERLNGKVNSYTTDVCTSKSRTFNEEVTL